MTRELKHFGILGMKWGIRRFQNLDGSYTAAGRERYRIGGLLGKSKKGEKYFNNGTLTRAGKEHYKQLVSKKYSWETNNNREQTEHSKDIVKELSNNSNGELVLKKGSPAYRVSTSDDIVSDKRKYVSITDKDRQAYLEWGINGYLGNAVNTQYTYETTRDLRVASGKEVIDHILSKYGDKYITGREITNYKKQVQTVWEKIEDEPVADNKYYKSQKLEYMYVNGPKLKDAYRLNEDLSDLPYASQYSLKKGSKKDRQFVSDVADMIANADSQVRAALQFSLFKNKEISSEIFNHFANKGYDAIVDAEDWFQNHLVDMPLIILNPSTSLKETSHENIFGDD